MKRAAPIFALPFFLAFLGAVIGGGILPAKALAKKGSLTIGECRKCHGIIFEEFDSDGGKHKANLTCLDCHKGHPPEVKNNIPKCSQCHMGQRHFQVKIKCLSCHRNPHTPLKISFPRGVTTPCLLCHPDKGKQFRDFPSRHSKEACTFCHRAHVAPPHCQQCHQPHSQAAASVPCTMCHQAHKPLDVTYGDSVPSIVCAACHPDKAKELAQGKTAHSKLRCVNCHRNKHGFIPHCVYCHEPHPQQSNQSGCTMCHHPHAPLPVKKVTFGPDTPSSKCAQCHQSILDTLRAGKTLHHTLECVFCHPGEHGTIPHCQDCHGDTPHPKRILAKFPNCETCHTTAHTLIR